MAIRALFLILPVLVSAAPSLDKRQLGLFAFAPGPPQQPIKITKNTASLYEGSIRQTLLYGPFKITAANGTHAKASASSVKLDPNSDIVSTQVVGVRFFHAVKENANNSNSFARIVWSCLHTYVRSEPFHGKARSNNLGRLTLQNKMEVKQTLDQEYTATT
jgi:hypothetical protein